MKIKEVIYVGGILLAIASLNVAFTSKNKSDLVESKTTRVTFKLRGTGSKGIAVKVGIGDKVGTGSCCSTVSPNSTVSFTGNDGQVVYDSERKRVITKIYPGLEGTTLELKDYY